MNVTLGSFLDSGIFKTVSLLVRRASSTVQNQHSSLLSLQDSSLFCQELVEIFGKAALEAGGAEEMEISKEKYVSS